MKGAAWLRVELYMQTQVLSGFIYQPHQERLFDLLNGVWVRQPESRGRFLELSEVTIHYVDGKTERLPSALSVCAEVVSASKAAHASLPACWQHALH